MGSTFSEGQDSPWLAHKFVLQDTSLNSQPDPEALFVLPNPPYNLHY
jgi:hypothetical protein